MLKSSLNNYLANLPKSSIVKILMQVDNKWGPPPAPSSHSTQGGHGSGPGTTFEARSSNNVGRTVNTINGWKVCCLNQNSTSTNFDPSPCHDKKIKRRDRKGKHFKMRNRRERIMVFGPNYKWFPLHHPEAFNPTLKKKPSRRRESPFISKVGTRRSAG